MIPNIYSFSCYVIVIKNILLIFVPEEAVILTVPLVIPVTTPDELTVAIFILSLVHFRVGQVIVFLFWSKQFAVSCVVLPVLIDKPICIDDNTGTDVTVMADALLIMVPDDAVIFTLPIVAPVTNPLESTIAIYYIFIFFRHVVSCVIFSKKEKYYNYHNLFQEG